ncbi:MAG: M56 family metallopeptidase [Acutalibacteraceae bacterium]
MLREVLTVSALILAVLLVRAIFKNRVPKRMVYTLWLVVLVKLCLPGTLVSLPVLPAEEAAAPVQRVELPAQPLPAQQPAQAVTQPQTPVQQPVSPGAGGHGSARKAADSDADLSDRLGGRERAAWALVIWYMAGIYGSASQEPAFSWQTRQDAYLHFQHGQIAVSGRAGSGSLSDGGSCCKRIRRN